LTVTFWDFEGRTRFSGLFSAVDAVLGMSDGGAGGGVGPDLGFPPNAAGGEIDAERSGGSVGWEDCGEAVAKGWKRCGQGKHSSGGGHAREMKGEAGGVEVAVKGCWIFAAKSQRCWR
jgi:hypothetical protein